jgi:hypothetical protein
MNHAMNRSADQKQQRCDDNAVAGVGISPGFQYILD